MTNNMEIALETEKDFLKIIVNGKTKERISIKNKAINTKRIYELLKYNENNSYVLNCERIDDEETRGNKNEMNRLYNYVYDLFKMIIDSINDINKNS